MTTKVSKTEKEAELVEKGIKMLEVAVILIVGLMAVGLVFPSVLTLALEIALGIAIALGIKIALIDNKFKSHDPMSIELRIGTILVILLLFYVLYFAASTYLITENAVHSLNTSNSSPKNTTWILPYTVGGTLQCVNIYTLTSNGINVSICARQTNST